MLKRKILDCLNEMEAGDLIQIHNEYCDAVNDPDNRIYSMDDLGMLCEGQSAEWIICRTIFGDCDINDDYIMFNGYGNFRTMNDHNAWKHIYADDIADYIEREMDSLYNDEIQDILDEYEEAAENA